MSPSVGTVTIDCADPQSPAHFWTAALGIDGRAGEVRRLTGLGVTVVEEHEMPGLVWTVLTDPEGNEFCVGTHE